MARDLVLVILAVVAQLLALPGQCWCDACPYREAATECELCCAAAGTDQPSAHAACCCFEDRQQEPLVALTVLHESCAAPTAAPLPDADEGDPPPISAPRAPLADDRPRQPFPACSTASPRAPPYPDSA